MDKKRIERRSLTISAIVNLISGLLGLAVYIVTDLNSLLLDAVFTLIAFVSTLAALLISKNSHRTTTAFPNGLYFLEPLYGVIKSLAILLLLFITFLETSSTAFRFFFENQGIPMTTDFVLPYTVITSIMCFGLAFYNHQKSKELNHMSTIVQAESKGNLIDGLISMGVGVAILLLHLIPMGSSLDFLHYTGDFFITICLIVLFIKEPIQVLVTSFKEFANSTIQGTQLEEKLRLFLEEHYGSPLSDMEIFVYKQGMQLTARIYVAPILQDGQALIQLSQDRIKLYDALKEDYPYLTIEFVY
ncbi:cation transporter [Streptococcus cameli]